MFELLFEAVDGAPHPELMFAHVNSEFRITRNLPALAKALTEKGC